MLMEVNPLQVVLFLLGFGAILFLTYVTTKFIAGKSGKALKGKHIQVVETVSLGLDKRIHLVKAGNRHILISSTSKSIGFLAEVDVGDGGEKAEEPSEQQNVFNFRELFDKYVGAYRNSGTSRKGKNDLPDEPPDTGNFRKNLGKLRTIVHKTDQVEKNGDDATNEK